MRRRFEACSVIGLGLLAPLLALTGCDLKPPYVILTINDPNKIAAGAVRVAASAEGQSPQFFDLNGKPFPVTLTVSSERGVDEERTITIAAVDAEEKTVGKGYVRLRFAANRAPTAAVQLSRPCTMDSDCDNENACDGFEVCKQSESSSEKLCEFPGVAPCNDGNSDPNDGCDGCQLTRWTSTVVVGADANSSLSERSNADDRPALASDRAGNLFVADPQRHRVLRVDAATAEVSVVAGNGVAGYSGDGGPAATAQISRPVALAVDGFGNLFICERGNGVIRSVDARTGVISTVAGARGLAPGTTQLDVDAKSIGLSPVSVAVDGIGNLFIGEAVFQGDGETATMTRVLMVAATSGRIRLYAGNGTPGFFGDQTSPTDGDAVLANIQVPYRLAVDRSGNLYIADGKNFRIRRVRPGSPPKIDTYAGTGSPDFFGEGGPAASAAIGLTTGMVVDDVGDMLISDGYAFVVRYIQGRSQVIRKVVGEPRQAGMEGDGGPAADARLIEPGDLALDTDKNLWIMDGYRLRQVSGLRQGSGGTISLKLDLSPKANESDDEPPPLTTRQLINPNEIALAADGRILVVDDQNLRRFELATGREDAVSGVSTVERLTSDSAGSLYVLESNAVRRINAQGEVSLYFATAPFSDIASGPDGELFVLVERQVARIRQGANQAENIVDDPSISQARSIAAASDGTVYLAGGALHAVMRIRPDRRLDMNFAGSGQEGHSGDGGPAGQARMYEPIDVAVDRDGNLFIADGQGLAVRRVDASTGIIETVAGGRFAPNERDTIGPVGDGGLATLALVRPRRIAITPEGELLILESDRVRRVDSSGIITTIIGPVDPIDGSLGRGLLGRPAALVRDGDIVYIADGSNGRVRSVDFAANRIRTVAGYPLGFDDQANAVLARYARFFNDASGIALDPVGRQLFVSERGSHVIRRITLDAEGGPIISLYAGEPGVAGENDGPIRHPDSQVRAHFTEPAGLAFDQDEQLLYIADSGNHIIRQIQVNVSEPRVSTIAGVPRLRGRCCEGVQARQGLLNYPEAVAIAKDGTYYIADTQNSQVRWVTADGRISVVLGDGSPSSSGEGAPAKQFPVDQPKGLAVDQWGNLFVTSRTTIREVIAAASGQAEPTSEVRTIYGITNPERYPEAITRCLTGIAVMDGVSAQGGRALIIDGCQGLLLELRRERIGP